MCEKGEATLSNTAKNPEEEIGESLSSKLVFELSF